MRILDILNAPWGLAKNNLSEMTGVYLQHLKGEKPDFKALTFHDTDEPEDQDLPLLELAEARDRDP